jgi:hypothetical protein
VLVVDAALAVELSLDRLGEQADGALGGEQLVAPCLLWSEVPSSRSTCACDAAPTALGWWSRQPS